MQNWGILQKTWVVEKGYENNFLYGTVLAVENSLIDTCKSY